MNAILDFLKQIQTASFKVPELVEWVHDFIHGTTYGNLNEYWALLKDLIGAIAGYLPLVLAALALVQCFFGKKLMGLQRFIIIFAVGFGVGRGILGPILEGWIADFPDWIPGIVCGVILGLLSKFLCWVVLAVGGAYCGYYFLLRCAIFPEAFNWIICAAIAVVAVILVFIFLKYVEILATSACGAYLAYTALIAFPTIGSMVDGLGFPAIKWIVMGVLFVLGAFVQIITRKRYY